MSEFISGKEALIAYANGKSVQYQGYDKNWRDDIKSICLLEFSNGSYVFRLKPRTMKLEIEVPAPFEPKDGEEFFVIDNGKSCGFLGGKYREDVNAYKTLIQFGAYRTEEDIKKVVEQLRKLGVLK